MAKYKSITGLITEPLTSSHHKIPSVTTANLPGAGVNAAIPAVDGMIVYNTTLGMLQQRASGIWSGITTAPVITSFVYSDGAAATAEKTVVGLASISCTTQTSTTVLVPGASLGIEIGMRVAGVGIPVGATVVSVIDDTSFVLSAAATDSATKTLTFGGVVTINGTNFDSILAGGSSNAGVTFDGTSATSISVNSLKTIITCTPPAHAAGTIVLQVLNASGLTAETNFVYDEEAIFTTAAGSLGSFPDGAYTANADAPRIQATDGEGSPSALTTGFERVTSASDATVITSTIQGLTILTSGYLTGTLSATVGTTYPFYATAKDSQNQRTAPRLFNIISAYPVTGGNTTVTSGGYRYHVFTTHTTSQNLVVVGTISADILMVGGGATAGRGDSGGGGGGGMIVGAAHTLNAAGSPYAVVVGAGGVAITYQSTSGTTPIGHNGNHSTAFGETARGGGHGGSYFQPPYVGVAGGSGGGGAGRGGPTAGGGANQPVVASPTMTGYADTGGYGHQGPSHRGGGGGGAGGGGKNWNETRNGGAGRSLAWTTEYTVTGSGNTSTALLWAGGGGGCAYASGVQAGNGGTGGGGGGGNGDSGGPGAGGTGGLNVGNPGGQNSQHDGGAGGTNTGGGGGGIGQGTAGVTVAGAGGSGIVIVRYAP